MRPLCFLVVLLWLLSLVPQPERWQWVDLAMFVVLVGSFIYWDDLNALGARLGLPVEAGHDVRGYGWGLGLALGCFAVFVVGSWESGSADPLPEPTAGAAVDRIPWDDNENGRVTCAEARRHGIAPVPLSHPAYAYMRDDDGDGVVCD